MSRAYDRAPNPRPRRASRAGQDSRPVAEAAAVVRRCLRCDKAFAVPSRFVRCCQECHRSDAWRGYAIDV